MASLGDGLLGSTFRRPLRKAWVVLWPTLVGALAGVPVAHAVPGERFDAWLMTDFPAADGFDFPVGDADGRGSYVDRATGRTHHGWDVATRFAERYSLGIHPGEDWNGAGGGNTDLGQEVRAVAHGRVAFAGHCGKLWGNVVMVDHVFYENHERRVIRSVYAHLADVRAQVGQTVRRRQTVGSLKRRALTRLDRESTRT